MFLFFLDVVPVAIRPPHAQNLLNTLSTVKMMVELSQAKVILTNSSIAKLLRCKVCFLKEHLSFY